MQACDGAWESGFEEGGCGGVWLRIGRVPVTGDCFGEGGGDDEGVLGQEQVGDTAAAFGIVCDGDDAVGCGGRVETEDAEGVVVGADVDVWLVDGDAATVGEEGMGGFRLPPWTLGGGF